MNRGDMKSATRRLYGEDSERYVQPEDLDEWLNEGLRELVADTDTLESKTTFETEKDKVEYDSSHTGFPSDFVKVLKVYYDDNELRYIDFRHIIDLDQSSGVPGYYYVRLHPHKLGLHPPPDKAKTVTLYYVAEPAVLNTDNAEPQIPAAYHRALVYFTAAQWAMSDDNFARADRLMQQFEKRKTAFLGSGDQRTGEGYQYVRYMEP